MVTSRKMPSGVEKELQKHLAQGSKIKNAARVSALQEAIGSMLAQGYQHEDATIQILNTMCKELKQWT